MWCCNKLKDNRLQARHILQSTAYARKKDDKRSFVKTRIEEKAKRLSKEENAFSLICNLKMRLLRSSQ
jgi:hypothetical protein